MGCGCGPYRPDGNGNTIAGQLVPPGGTDGQLLAKASDGAFDVEWVDPPTTTSPEGFATSEELAALQQQVDTGDEAHLLLEQEVEANALTTNYHTTQIQKLHVDPDMPRSPVDGYVLKFDAALGDDGLWTAMPDLQGAPGSGTGDMMQSVYDTDNNGIVDNSERLGGNLPSHFATADHNHDGTYADATHDHDGTYSPVGHVHQDYADGLAALEATASGLQDQIDNHEGRIADLETAPPPSGGTNLHFGTYILAKPATPQWGDPVGVYDPDASVLTFESKALLNPVVPSGSAYPGNVGYMHEYWGNRLETTDGLFQHTVNGVTCSWATPVSTGVDAGGQATLKTSTPVVPVPQSPAELVYLENVTVVPIDNPSSGLDVPYFRLGPSGLNFGTPPPNSGSHASAYAWPVVGTVSGWFPARNLKESPDYSGGGISQPG